MPNISDTNKKGKCSGKRPFKRSNDHFEIYKITKILVLRFEN